MEAKRPVIVLTGGGTGGHITPILALAEELKALDPSVKTVYIGEKGGRFDELTSGHAAIDETYAIQAGKFRRYHGESWLRRLADVRTNLLNLRDAFRLGIGILQARRVLRRISPDIIFQKGGFVGVPVSVAASRSHIPIITHDSDALPGLANRLVSRWVTLHATALPANLYPYPKDKVLQVGVLVERAYQPVTPETQKEAKLRLVLNPDEPVLLITGGSSGAATINQAVTHFVATLLQNHSTLQIIHQVGKGKADVYGDFTHARLKILEFMQPMTMYTAAADVIVTRAGANAMAEFGVQGKACIVVPSPHLTGGHQIKNAQILAEQGAALVVPEDKLYDSQHGLFAAITDLLIDPHKREELAKKLQSQTIPDAAHRLAITLLDQIKQKDPTSP